MAMHAKRSGNVDGVGGRIIYGTPRYTANRWEFEIPRRHCK